jgi:2-polyprenyl-3-methyl-5-hydroxy-6-metoxy-1,4-benzoquinol methylase
VDRSHVVVEAAKQRYEHRKNLRFISEDLLSLQLDGVFDLVVSFETIEHFAEPDIQKLLATYSTSLKPSSLAWRRWPGREVYILPKLQRAIGAATTGKT